jgi:hypothetical protein
MSNKELIEDNKIAIVSGLFPETIKELLSRNLKALKDAEETEIMLEDILYKYEKSHEYGLEKDQEIAQLKAELRSVKSESSQRMVAINLLKAKLFEQVDPIDLPKMYESKKQEGTYFDKSKNKRLTAYQKGWNEAIKAVKKQFKKERE